jgi:hypothetical protein
LLSSLTHLFSWCIYPLGDLAELSCSQPTVFGQVKLKAAAYQNRIKIQDVVAAKLAEEAQAK